MLAPCKALLKTLSLCAICSMLVCRAHADPIASGSFTADDSSFSYSFSTTTAQNYTFATTSFAAGGFVPVLTLFSSTGGTPLAFAETDNSDVSLNQTLGAGSYILYLTEDPNVFTSTLAAGPLFAGSSNITGDLCGVAGGQFLNVFDGCSQRSSSYALSGSSSTATPEPDTFLLTVLPAAALALSQRRRLFI